MIKYNGLRVADLLKKTTSQLLSESESLILQP